ncbi:MAG: class II glutamine amidotransferase [Rhodothermia bacterium]|nr:MAG: class II glutamine amidotransferase [Rhodothermia bacterium]
MCRLYEFRSNTLRKVECELIHSQNSLLAQSQHDERGEANPDGWGLAAYIGARPSISRQAEAASESADFRWEAALIYSRNVMAHVRRATIGKVATVNTHPFTHEEWTFAHNGNLGAFVSLKPRLLDLMGEAHRSAIQGDTDSEHVFHWLLSRIERKPAAPLISTVRRGVQELLGWSLKEDANAEFVLNIILTNANRSVGCRLGRSLWYVERDVVHPCGVCDGIVHVEPSTLSDPYRAVVVASERITQNEEWTSVPERTLFEISDNLSLNLESL